jgi:hypothetical protein
MENYDRITRRDKEEPVYIRLQEMDDKELDSLFSPTQVTHDPRQVTSPDQLKIGTFCKDYSIRGKLSGIVKVVGEPKDGKVRVTKRNDNGEWLEEEDIILTDRGIIPYQFNGKWNAYNYLLQVDESEVQPRSS